MNLKRQTNYYAQQFGQSIKLRHRKPCKECPWLKTSAAGYFGQFTPESYLADAHGEVGTLCHSAKKPFTACVGALQHANAAHKSYRNPLLRLLQAMVGLNPNVLNLREFYAHHIDCKKKRRKS